MYHLISHVVSEEVNHKKHNYEREIWGFIAMTRYYVEPITYRVI